MININLLPESMRKKEGMPRQQFLGVVVGVALVCVLLVMIIKYTQDILPELQLRQRSLQQQKNMLQGEMDKLKQINSEISRMSSYVDAVKGLYKNRIIWAKILSDIKSIVNFDKTMSVYNPEQRYLWLTNFSGRGKNISLKCFATSSSQVVAMQMPELLLKELRSFAPEGLPEKDEEARLLKELEQAKLEHDIERNERPELPIQGPREQQIRRRLEEIQSAQSGGIALLPFYELLVPGSIQLKSASWSSAPSPPNAAPGGEIFPKMAWTFDIEMTLR